MTNITRDLCTIRRMGIEALIEKLGPVGMVEFIRQFDSGYGDYTKERYELLNDIDIPSIVDKIETKRNKDWFFLIIH